MEIPSNRINLLIIEDHTISAEAYRNIIKRISKLNFNISHARNCDEALEEINNKQWDLVLLDLRIPVSKGLKFLGGEDLANYIRKISPNTRIIVLTSIMDRIVADNIFKEFRPEGFLIKSDIVAETLVSAVINVINGNHFYSETVENFLYNEISITFSIDDFDRQILYWLSMGVKTKDICNHIPLSHRAIEVRKSKLIEVLVENKNSSNLIIAAKDLGII
ncbi:MAG: response regulator [Crocinitomicaceae bacterium]